MRPAHDEFDSTQNPFIMMEILKHSTAMQEEPTVVVIGAGVIGCMAARCLARDHNVLVLDRDSIAGGSSKLAGASVSSSKFVSDLPVIAGHINQWFRDYAETGRVDLTLGDDLEPVVSDRAADVRDRVAEMTTQGYPVSFIDGSKLADRHPWMETSDFGGAVHHQDYAWVDPVEYTLSLAEEAREDGATIRTEVEVTDLRVDGGRVVGVETDNGTVDADTVIAAAGWRTDDLLSDRVTFPMRPYITQGCEIAVDLDISVERFPTVRIPVEPTEGSIYRDNRETLLIRPKHNGNLRVAGGHNAYERDQYDYLAASDGISAERDFVKLVEQAIPNLLRDVSKLDVVDTWAGTGGGLTPDKRPIIDIPESVDDLVVATGFRAGFILSPIAGQGVRSLVTGEGCPFNMSPFAVDRF